MIIKNIQYYLPSKRIPIQNLQKETGLSSDELTMFQKIYGLKEVLIEDTLSISDMLNHSVKKLLDKTFISPQQVRYIIHAHTSSLLTPFGHSLVQMIKEKFQFKNALAFSTTTHKCVSALKAFELFSMLLDEKQNQYALLLTGEIAFTPELRLIPRSGITGDAATATLIEGRGSTHELLATDIFFFPGFCKGIYLSQQELQRFDKQFLQTMKQTILTALTKARIDLDQINWIFPHNINLPTWKKIAAILSFPLEKIYLNNLSWTGHCFASDGILNLAIAQENNLLKKGDKYLMVSCGMGFYFGCAVFQY